MIVVPEATPLLANLSSAVTPDHSDTLTASAFEADSVTVTELTDGAASRYQISTRLFVPLRNPTGPFSQLPLGPAESFTVLTEAELPAASATTATSR